MTTLFRPVGLHELSLIWDSGMREFPPRLPHQPIFYPVANAEYATQIARNWNTKDSSFAGYVTKFGMPDWYLSKFEPHTVGSALHVEYWIPAEQLSAFNAAIQGMISVESAYFGAEFEGFVPNDFGLKGKNVVAQFVTIARLWSHSRNDFVSEVSINRKTIFLNFLFWGQYDFTTQGINAQQRESIIAHLKECWELNQLEVPLPAYP